MAILAKNGQILQYQNFPSIEYEFLKEDHKNNFHTKN